MSVSSKDTIISSVEEAATHIESDKRVRSLTEKGTAMFESNCKSHAEQIDRVSKKIEELAAVRIDTYTQIEACVDFKANVLHEFNTYIRLSKDYHDFLVRTNTAECNEILNSLKQSDSKYYLLAETVTSNVNAHINTLTGRGLFQNVCSLKILQGSPFPISKIYAVSFQ